MPLKQVIIVRSDLNLPKGKLAAQVSHASLEAVLKSNKKLIKIWRSDGAKKVVLKVENEKELKVLLEKAESADIMAELIVDAGHTVLEPGTVTCLGIGPDAEAKIDAVTGNLKML